MGLGGFGRSVEVFSLAGAFGSTRPGASYPMLRNDASGPVGFCRLCALGVNKEKKCLRAGDRAFGVESFVQCLKSTLPGPRGGSSISNVHLGVVAAAVLLDIGGGRNAEEARG